MATKVLSIAKEGPGNVVITTIDDRIVVDVRRGTPEKKVEAIRMALLLKGMVYTPKIHKKVVKALGI